MRMRKELTCIGCPMGCQISVDMDGEKILNIEGYTCEKGVTYAKKEVTNPTRIVTGSVIVTGSDKVHMVSVKTAQDIPKDKIFDCADAISKVTVKAPVKIGDVVIRNVAGTGVDVIATRGA